MYERVCTIDQKKKAQKNENGLQSLKHLSSWHMAICGSSG